MRDLAAQKLLVTLERRDHGLGVAAAERHYINCGKFQIRRHPYLRHGDDVAFKVGVVDTTLCQNIGNCMAHQFADAQLPLRAAGGGTFFLVVAGHFVSRKRLVMAGLVPATPVFVAVAFLTTWIPGTSPGMTPNYSLSF